MRIKNDVEAILASAKCKYPGVYFVGPYGARVSFASQQRRVLNLIWALTSKKILPKDGGKKVAVVGGGIAGLTAAAALLCRHCDVHLYEKEGDLLSMQMSANHRMVHPTINFWPEEDLAWTTSFPFLDWYAGKCVEVVNAIRRDWSGFEDRYGRYSPLADLLADLHDNMPVSGFKPNKGRVDVLVGKDRKRHDTYDLVLVTTGFGLEQTMGDPDQRSYWKDDEVERLSMKTGFRIAVSGTGDGGVIDALRLTYPGFMLQEIALRLIITEEKPGLRSELATIEEEADGIEDLGEKASFYAARYGAIARERSLRAKRLLPDLPPGKVPVTLIGQRAAPFDGTSAPIHKLILAHSLAAGRIEFVQGTLKRNRGKWMLTQAGAPPQEQDFDKVIVRHGAVPPARGFLGEAEATRLAGNQRLVGDFLPTNVGPIDAFYENARVYPPRGSPEFVARRYSLARDFLRRFSLDVQARLCDGVDSYFIAQPARDPVRNIEHLPTEIFGVSLVPPPRTIALADPLLDHTS